ncbi:hypothetical protein IFR05_012066 [Cadophora sp. M221]|nr:hypothetical protein IFR05_012066 [Cadophora sp. M221]
MVPPAERLSSGEHPIDILLFRTDDNSAEPSTRSEAGESQASSESHNEPTPSASLDEGSPDSTPSRNRSGSAPERLSPHSTSVMRRTGSNRAVKKACRNLLNDLKSNAPESSNAARTQNDEDSEALDSSESELSSSSSENSFDSDPDQDYEVGQTGEHFPNGDGPFPDINDESGLEDNTSPEAKASAAVTAPFREGGIPSISKGTRQLQAPSVVTDFGESLYGKFRKTRSRKSSSSVGRRVDRPRRPKKPDTLQVRLFKALVPTHDGRKEFFPRKVLATIVTQQCVQEELSKHLSETHSEKKIAKYAREICGVEYSENGVKKAACYRKIFVILVLIDKTPAIVKFLEMELSDRNLPLQLVDTPKKPGLKELRLSRDPERRLKCFSRSWNQHHIRDFSNYQWTTISPFFAKGGHKKVSHYPLQDNAILPFISASCESGRSKGRTVEFEGGFSRVIKVDIHPDHHNFDDTTNGGNSRSFAVKCLHSRHKPQFDNEVQMLKRFSDPSVPAHKHLISLLATYRQFDTFFLIFHWADADLRNYWKDERPNPCMNRETVLWVAEQCKGIAEGVVAIHQYKTSKLQVQPEEGFSSGHHGDIKPENVLWFPGPSHEQPGGGTLKLSDFGLAEISKHHTKSMQPKSNYATSLSYQAPEAEIEGTGAIGRSYDIWSLGCLYLEFITWLIGGWDLVTEFYFLRIPEDFVLGQDDTKFYMLKPVPISERKWKRTAELKPAVSAFIKRLLTDTSCTPFLREFIEMVRDDLLVIKTDSQDRDRAESQEVFSRLSKMLQKCHNDVGYGY